MDALAIILSVISVILAFHKELGLFESSGTSTRHQVGKVNNGFVQAAKNLESMDKTKYNCIIQCDGEWVYGWIEGKGAAHVEGINTVAYGERSFSEGKDTKVE